MSILNAETTPACGQSLLTEVLGVGTVRLHPHDNKFHAGNGEDGKHYWLTPPALYAELEARVAGDDPVRALIAKHAGLLADSPYAHYCYFELAYTRHTGWMAWICSNQREEDPDRKVLAKGQGWTPDEACRAALAETPNASGNQTARQGRSG